MLKCSYFCCIQHAPQDGEGLALVEVNDLCIVLMQKLVNPIADKVRIKTGLGNGCTATRGLAGQG